MVVVQYSTVPVRSFLRLDLKKISIVFQAHVFFKRYCTYTSNSQDFPHNYNIPIVMSGSSKTADAAAIAADTGGLGI